MRNFDIPVMADTYKDFFEPEYQLIDGEWVEQGLTVTPVDGEKIYALLLAVAQIAPYKPLVKQVFRSCACNWKAA